MMIEEKKIKIELLNEGWITEIFLILKILNKESNDIKSIFQVYKEDKMTIKEIIKEKEKLLNSNYPEFINLIKNETKNKTIGSDKIDWKMINGLEIRLNKKLKNRDIGINENYYNILFKEIVNVEIL